MRAAQQAGFGSPNANVSAIVGRTHSGSRRDASLYGSDCRCRKANGLRLSPSERAQTIVRRFTALPRLLAAASAPALLGLPALRRGGALPALSSVGGLSVSTTSVSLLPSAPRNR